MFIIWGQRNFFGNAHYLAGIIWVHFKVVVKTCLQFYPKEYWKIRAGSLRCEKNCWMGWTENTSKCLRFLFTEHFYDCSAWPINLDWLLFYRDLVWKTCTAGGCPLGFVSKINKEGPVLFQSFKAFFELTQLLRRIPCETILASTESGSKTVNPVNPSKTLVKLVNSQSRLRGTNKNGYVEWNNKNRKRGLYKLISGRFVRS